MLFASALLFFMSLVRFLNHLSPRSSLEPRLWIDYTSVLYEITVECSSLPHTLPPILTLRSPVILSELWTAKIKVRKRKAFSRVLDTVRVWCKTKWRESVCGRRGVVAALCWTRGIAGGAGKERSCSWRYAPIRVQRQQEANRMDYTSS